MDSKTKPNSHHNKEGDLTLAEKAYQSACRKLILERRRFGETIVVWRNGKVQHIPATEIVLPDEEK